MIVQHVWDDVTSSRLYTFEGCEACMSIMYVPITKKTFKYDFFYVCFSKRHLFLGYNDSPC